MLTKKSRIAYYRAQKSKAKKGAWFYAVRGSYLPLSRSGWLTYIPYISVLLGSEQWASNLGGTYTDKFFRLFPVWVAAAVVMQYIAKQKS